MFQNIFSISATLISLYAIQRILKWRLPILEDYAEKRKEEIANGDLSFKSTRDRVLLLLCSFIVLSGAIGSFALIHVAIGHTNGWHSWDPWPVTTIAQIVAIVVAPMVSMVLMVLSVLGFRNPYF